MVDLAPEVGVARTIAPVAVRNAKGKITGWRANYRDGDNRKRQAGIHRTQAAARRCAEERVAELNTGRGSRRAHARRLDEHLALPRRARPTDRQDPPAPDRRRTSTPTCGAARIGRSTQITREHLHDIQGALLARGLSKTTIDGAISSLSAVLGYALREHRIEINPALGARVDPADTRLSPAGERHERRWIPPEEAGRLLDAVALATGRWSSRLSSAGSAPRNCSPSASRTSTPNAS